MEKVDLEIEQFKSGISSFIFAWILHHRKQTGKSALECSQDVAEWVRVFCDSLEEEQKKADERSQSKNKDNIL